jgi:hypothetical protein
MAHHTDIDEPTDDMFEPLPVPSVFTKPEEPKRFIFTTDSLSGLALSGSAFTDLTTINAFNFCGEKGPIIMITLGDPPSVWVDPDLSWDLAAKHFWNHVYRMIGKPAPWPEID